MPLDCGIGKMVRVDNTNGLCKKRTKQNYEQKSGFDQKFVNILPIIKIFN